MALSLLLSRSRLQDSRHHQRHLRADRGATVGDDKRVVACGFDLLLGCSRWLSRFVVLRAESLPCRSKWRCLRSHRRSPCLACSQLGGGFPNPPKTNQVGKWLASHCLALKAWRTTEHLFSTLKFEREP